MMNDKVVGAQAGEKVADKRRADRKPASMQGMEGQAGAGEPIIHLRALADELNGSVAECLAEPNVEAVHHVRTGSRRVEAMLETVMRVYNPRAVGSKPNGADGKLHQAAKKWFRQLNKIRRAAGKVRDLDVHRKLVEEYYRKGTEEEHQLHAPDGRKLDAPVDSAQATPSSLHQQAEKIDGWLKRHRERQAATLLKQLGKRQTKLISVEQQCVAELTERRRRSGRSAKPVAVLALEDFLRLVDRMPALDAGNLHDFRKEAKKARYVAETGGQDREAQAIAKAINRVQDAIGDWHDFLILGEEAGTALGKHGAELRGEIGIETERLYRRALHTTELVKRRLVGEWVARRGRVARGLQQSKRVMPRSTERRSSRTSPEQAGQ